MSGGNGESGNNLPGVENNGADALSAGAGAGAGVGPSGAGATATNAAAAAETRVLPETTVLPESGQAQQTSILLTEKLRDIQPAANSAAEETTELETMFAQAAAEQELREAQLSPEERAARDRKARKKGLQVTAFVLALLALIPGAFVPPVGFVLGIVAFILAVIALAKKRRLAGLSISAVVLSVLAGIAGTIMVFVYLSFAAVTVSDRIEEVQDLLQEHVTEIVDGQEVPVTVGQRIREKLSDEEIAEAKQAVQNRDITTLQEIASKVVGREITQSEITNFLLTGDIPADIRENLLGGEEVAQ